MSRTKSARSSGAAASTRRMLVALSITETVIRRDDKPCRYGKVQPRKHEHLQGPYRIGNVVEFRFDV